MSGILNGVAVITLDSCMADRALAICFLANTTPTVAAVASSMT
jgi:hypothetical protein